MGKRSKEAVKARTKRRRKLKKQRYLSEKRQVVGQDESSHTFKLETPEKGSRSDLCRIEDSSCSADQHSEVSTKKERTPVTKINMPTEKFKQLKDDPLFTEMVKYQKNKRFTAFLHERVQHANPRV